MNIKINSLATSELSRKSLENDYLYKDLELDMAFQVYRNKQLNKSEPLKDVSALFDVEAVKNSILNAFLTSPGDKILNPTYGIDLRQYLFEPIDEFTSELIQDDIETKLPNVEPRVQVVNVEIIPDEDNNLYEINLEINIPSLNVYGLSIKSELNSSGYSIP